MKYIYPTLLKSANNIYKDSWFDLKIRKNNKYRKKKNVNMKLLNHHILIHIKLN